MTDGPVPMRQNAHSYQIARGRYGLTGLCVEEIPTTERVTPLGVRSGDVVLEPQSLYRVYTGVGFYDVLHASQLDVRPTLDAFLGGMRLDFTEVSPHGEVILYVSVTRNRPFSAAEILVEVSRTGVAQVAPAAPMTMPPPERPLIQAEAPAPVPVAPAPAPARPQLFAPPVPGGFRAEGPTKIAEVPQQRPAAIPPPQAGGNGEITDAEAARRVARWLDAPDTQGRVVGTDAPAPGVGLSPLTQRLISPASASGNGFAADIASHPRAEMKTT